MHSDRPSELADPFRNFIVIRTPGLSPGPERSLLGRMPKSTKVPRSTALYGWATTTPNGKTIGTDRLDPELRCRSLIGMLRRIPMRRQARSMSLPDGAAS